ncbi:acetyltransferase [Vibrio vulnificus]|nr:acetyltransferase [Vibrio vulnificus]EHZ2755520.1 acetyltransferase [Vibrio vulnificus]EHZ2763730.1 acetyltransferase [Vibrio vulnificus]EKD8804196.1 acetyltransferase [Vibrio vulnificus]EKD9321194.1 acetyltransferase [Vibrio vulnificus]
MKDKKLVIIGAGELAHIAYEYFTYDSDYEVVAFSVHEEYLKEKEMCSVPVVPFETLEQQYPPSEYDAFVAIPASKLNQVRTQLFHEAKDKGYKLATYVSSHAFVWRNVKLGENCFIFENNTVQPFVEIGDNVILWSGNHIGHQTKIQNNVFVSSHVVISGYCNIGESCFLGVNSTFNDHTSIGKDCILASGSLVNKSLKGEGKIYFGSPAKELAKKSAYSVDL